MRRESTIYRIGQVARFVTPLLVTLALYTLSNVNAQLSMMAEKFTAWQIETARDIAKLNGRVDGLEREHRK